MCFWVTNLQPLEKNQVMVLNSKYGWQETTTELDSREGLHNWNSHSPHCVECFCLVGECRLS
jgi:hypothetical protein